MEVGEDFVTNLNKKDAFEEAFQSVGMQAEKVHVRVQIRNGKKCITTVQGLAEDLDLHRITRALKKSFKCNGAVVKDEKGGYGDVIQLTGDHRNGIVDFLVSEEIVPKDMIVVHGF
jgi:translation initiation factor 1